MHFSKLCTIWLRFSFHSFACLIFFSYILYERCWREPVNETFIANNCFKAIILHTANQDVESKQKNRGKRSSEKSPDRLAVCDLIRHVLTFIDTWWPLVSVVFINAAKEDVRWWCIKSSKTWSSGTSAACFLLEKCDFSSCTDPLLHSKIQFNIQFFCSSAATSNVLCFSENSDHHSFVCTNTLNEFSQSDPIYAIRFTSLLPHPLHIIAQQIASSGTGIKL